MSTIIKYRERYVDQTPHYMLLSSSSISKPFLQRTYFTINDIVNTWLALFMCPNRDSSTIDEKVSKGVTMPVTIHIVE